MTISQLSDVLITEENDSLNIFSTRGDSAELIKRNSISQSFLFGVKNNQRSNSTAG